VPPIVGGRAIKGPTAKIMTELGLPVTVQAVADHYRDLLDGVVIDEADAGEADHLGMPVAVTGTVMQTMEDRDNLARAVLGFAFARR